MFIKNIIRLSLLGGLAQFTKGFGAVCSARFYFFFKKIYFSKKVNFGVVYKGAPRSLSKPVNVSKSDHGFY